MLSFKIVSSRIADDVDKDKKYVAYMLQVERGDPNKSINVERRYTHFADLYHGLNKDFPALMNSVTFPRKILMGNFDPEKIKSRCLAFESLLILLATDSRLREHPAAVAFFQDAELLEGRRLINKGYCDMALHILEISFKLLNKVYTERSRVVISALCRVVAIASLSGGTLAVPVEPWAQLALKRYEAVCDSDLLLIYVPLLHTCISIWDTLGRDKKALVDELESLRMKGMKVDSVPSLMEAVDSLSYTT